MWGGVEVSIHRGSLKIDITSTPVDNLGGAYCKKNVMRFCCSTLFSKWRIHKLTWIYKFWFDWLTMICRHLRHKFWKKSRQDLHSVEKWYNFANANEKRPSRKGRERRAKVLKFSDLSGGRFVTNNDKNATEERQTKALPIRWKPRNKEISVKSRHNKQRKHDRSRDKKFVVENRKL